MQRLENLPGFGLILAATVALEIGEVSRFANCEHLASYAGTPPQAHSSGDKTRYGRLRADVNRHLKWAYVEAANVVSLQQYRWPDRHVVQLYRRVRQRRCHAKAVGAVARHLAEASFWVLRRGGRLSGTGAASGPGEPDRQLRDYRMKASRLRGLNATCRWNNSMPR